MPDDGASFSVLRGVTRRPVAGEAAFYNAAETMYRARVAQMPADFSMRVERYRLEK